MIPYIYTDLNHFRHCDRLAMCDRFYNSNSNLKLSSMRKSLLFLLNTLLAAATLCVVSCGIDDVDAEDGAIQFELYDTEGTLIEGLQSMKFGATTAYTLKSAFVTYTEVTAPAGWKCASSPARGAAR